LLYIFLQHIFFNIEEKKTMFQQLTNQIVEAYQALERENAMLKSQLEIMQRQNEELTKQVDAYEFEKMPKEGKDVLKILYDGFSNEIDKATDEKKRLTELYEAAEENRRKEARKLAPEYNSEKVKPFEEQKIEYAKQLEEVTALLKKLKLKRTTTAKKLERWNTYESAKRPRTDAMEKCISCNVANAKYYMPVLVCSEKCAKEHTRKSLLQ
jgi:hypothetical protein